MPSQFIKNLSQKAREDNLLTKICTNMKKNLALVPVVGVEIEFYATKELDLPRKYNLKKEKGQNQFEIDISPHSDLVQLVLEIEATKNYLLEVALNSDAVVSFHPKLHENDYGNAMHFHVNFLNENGDNIFESSTALENAARSLCYFMLDTFLIFAPEDYHYNRFITGRGMMAPTHISYGGNNRTVAIRIPDASPKRLEHRISSPETDSYIALCAIMQSIYLGMQNLEYTANHSKIYGNAHDEQYNLVSLPKDLNEAYRFYRSIF